MFLSTFCLLTQTGFPPECGGTEKGGGRIGSKKLERGKNMGKSRKEVKIGEEVGMREK